MEPWHAVASMSPVDVGDHNTRVASTNVESILAHKHYRQVYDRYTWVLKYVSAPATILIAIDATSKKNKSTSGSPHYSISAQRDYNEK